MTLEEKLREMGDAFVYVGAHEGYLYIGPANDAFDLMPEISKVYGSRTIKMHTSACNSLKYLESGEAEKEWKQRRSWLIRARDLNCDICKGMTPLNIQRDKLAGILGNAPGPRKSTAGDTKDTIRYIDNLDEHLRLAAKNLDEEIDSTIKSIEGIPEKITYFKKKIAAMEKSLAKADLLTRRVIETHDVFEGKDKETGMITSPAGTAIIFEGTEGGDYWDYAEWLNPEIITHAVKCAVHKKGSK